jgi:hypothetical protein
VVAAAVAVCFVGPAVSRDFGPAVVVTDIGQSSSDCARNPDVTRWFVQAGAAAGGAGTRARPFGALADVERCAPEGARILVLPAPEDMPPLDGGIRLKPRQKLLGAHAESGSREAVPLPRLTNTGGSGDAITLGHENEVAHLHIENPAGAAIFGDNVRGALLHDLRITRRATTAPSPLDPALCRVVRAGGTVDHARSTLRGCTARQAPFPAKHAVMLLVDEGVGAAKVTHSVERVRIEDNPSHEQPRALWPVGVSITAAGRADVTLEIRDSSIEHTIRGFVARASDRAAVTATLTGLRLDSLRSDGIGVTTGFVCSGMDAAARLPGNLDCSTLAPAPVSDARLVVNVDGLRFTDTAGHGQPNDAAAIEPVAYDQGRSTIELHVQRSDIIGAAAVGVFTFYVHGWPAKDVIDFGCVNPAPGDPATLREDRAACGALGYSSPGLNRIFGNTRNSKSYSPHAEVALEGPGRMIAQGNYWGDISPVDGRGDALGDCVVFNWSGEMADDPPPVKEIPGARCELYNIRGKAGPDGIDGRFPLTTDPRPPK